MFSIDLTGKRAFVAGVADDAGLGVAIPNAPAEGGGALCLDIVVRSLANGPEVKNALLATSRRGYLGAVGVSSYSMVALVQRLGPIMRPGGAFMSLSYLAAERVIPGYGGGMSSAKAALESDT